MPIANDIVENSLVPVLTANESKTEIISQSAGGWEGWLQCELFDFIFNQVGPAIEREYYVDSQRIDLVWMNTSKTTGKQVPRYYIELKCLGLNRIQKETESKRNAAIKDFLTGVLNDWAKLAPIAGVGSDVEFADSIISIACIPNFGPELINEIYKVLVTENQYSYYNAVKSVELTAGVHIFYKCN